VIGFIGLGNIGGQMATRLPHDQLLVHDIREEAAAPFVEKGARFGSLKDLAVECDVISIVVLTDAQIREVVGQLLEHATAGTVIALHSTIDTHTAPELAAAIARVRDGDAVFSPRLAGFVLDAFQGEIPEAEIDPELDQLTLREREVLRLIARGYLYKEIALRLDISPKTVEAHVSAVLRKLQLSNRHELSRWAAERRLVE